MSRALRAELLKLRTTRTFFAMVASAVALAVLIVVLVTSLSTEVTQDDVREIFGNTDTAWLFVLLLGVIGMAGEWRHRTIASTVLAVPQRLRLMVAKLLAYATAGVVLSLLVNLAVMTIGTLILSGRGEQTLGFADLVDILWRNLVVAGYFGALGVCIGALIRNPPVAIVVVLMWIFVIGFTLSGVAPGVWKYDPFGGVASGILQASQEDDDELLPVGLALLAAAGWVAAGVAAATATFTKRDLV